MMLLSVLLALTLCSEPHVAQAPQGPGPAPQGPALDTWEASCSQGLECSVKKLDLFSPPCRSPPKGVNQSPVIQNVSLSTTLRCQGRHRCSLHLRVSAALLLTSSVRGLSICILTPGMMQRCKQVSFSKSSSRRMKGRLVEVESECVEISPGQEGRVKVQTLPELCGVRWTGPFQGPECSSDEVMSLNVPQCITGRLQYELQPEGRGLTVAVSDMLEDWDYRLRLCLEGFVCSGIGADALIKKEEVVKKVSLPFSRPLPCLCIEGWSAVMDAPRVRVCPFKDRVAELWFGVTFAPLEQELSWQPACPINVVVSLCEMGGEGECADLPHAQTTRSSKVTFSKVDPHPRLCVKFSTDSQSWTRCPFANYIPNMRLKRPPHTAVPPVHR